MVIEHYEINECGTNCQNLPSPSVGFAPLATLSPEGEGRKALLPPGEGWGEQSEGAEGGRFFVIV